MKPCPETETEALAMERDDSARPKQNTAVKPNTKKVKLTLVGLDGNAFSLLGAFQRQARREGWSKDEIDAVVKEATSGDYNHLLCTLMDNCEDLSDIQ